MSIHYDKDKGAYRFAFKRIIEGKLIRATRLLPKGWSQDTANAFDVKETARLFAVHSGNSHSRPLIEDAVVIYLEEHTHQLETHNEFVREYTMLHPLYVGKTLDELYLVAQEINRLKRSPSTRRKKIRLLTAACNYAFKYHGMGTSKPSDRVVVPQVMNERNNPPSRLDVLRIARAIKSRDVRACVLVAFYSGMRMGEVLRAVYEDGLFKLFKTKNKQLRFVPVHPKVRVYVSRFPNPCGKAKLHNHFVKAKEALSLESYHFHDIRHGAATAMVNAGVDLYTVGAVLGHKSPISTKRYAHLMTTTLNTALNTIGGKDRKRHTEKKKDLSIST